MLPFPELVAKPVPPCLSCCKENGFILAHLLELNLSVVSGPAHLSIQTPFTDSLRAQSYSEAPNTISGSKGL